MDAAETRTIRLTVRNELSEIGQLRDALDRHAEELAMPADSLAQLQVAVDELVSNVIRHAWPPGGSHRFVVSMTLSAGTARIDVIDDGVSFDPRRAPVPMPPGSASKRTIGGRGLMMLPTLVDRVDYVRVGNQNHTTLHKHW
jgi:anti-sigma regulatory factor (Ser/Thr protein kinase)